MKLLAITILTLLNLTLTCSCRKSIPDKPYYYVNLRIEGFEDDIWWEETTGNWTDSNGKLDIDARSYYFDQFKLRLSNVLDTGIIPNLDIDKIYFTDGIDFRPHGIHNDFIKIVYRNNTTVRGTFEIYFKNNYNGTTDKSVSGEFGVMGY